VRSFFRPVISPLLDFLYPPLCLSCGDRLAESDALLCTPCTRRAPGLDYHDVTLQRARIDLCNECAVEDMTVLWHFEGPVRDLVHSIKYGGLRSAAEKAGGRLGRHLERAPDRWLPDLIIPVPLHPARLRERGYNQSACIARGVSRISGVPVCEDAAVRTRNTATQTSLDRLQRRENVAGAFRIRRPEIIRDARVLIVDDVVTTGATVGALALALQQSGSRACAVAGLAIALNDVTQAESPGGRGGQRRDGRRDGNTGGKVAPAGLARCTHEWHVR
jgi:ComF family protein